MALQHVLVISTKLDAATDAVVAAVGARGRLCTRIDTEDFPFDSALTVNIDETAVRSTFCGPHSSVVMLEDASAVWYRRIRVPRKPDAIEPGVYDFCLRESRSALLGAIMGQRVRMMSAPGDVWAAEHKPLQLIVAREIGLPTPSTVITNDPVAIRAAFRRFDGGMIAKPVRTGFVDYGDEQHAVFTTQILEEHLDDLSAAHLSPTIFQPLVPKKCDVRATVVGNKIFVAEIDSQTDEAARVDWRRTTNSHLPHRRATLPPAVEGRIFRMMKRLGLTFGALDFVRTPDDQYVFLEVNPNGQWLWLDDMLGFDITGAVADWLTGATL